MSYVVSLSQFEGPLDLLLHLISKAKIDIHDIFVSQITEQYLESMQGIEELDMDTASEFLTMAATLLEIKSRALLPKPPEPEDPDAETPEQALLRRLEEYKAIKEGTEHMKEFEKAAMMAFSKLPEEYPLPPPQVELTGLSMNGLLRALERILQRQPRPGDQGRVFRSIMKDRYTIEQCVYSLTSRLRKGPVLFSEMLSSDVTRDEIVSYFMAVLELMKLGRVHARQEETYDDILLEPAGKEEQGNGRNAAGSESAGGEDKA